MRLLALIFVLLLGLPMVSSHPVLAQTGAAENQVNVDDMRATLRGALNSSRQFLSNVMSEAKDTTGLNDEQLFGVGVGMLAGLLVADVVGTGSIGRMLFFGAGGLFGKWVTTPK